jgi:hypothetical protein
MKKLDRLTFFREALPAGEASMEHLVQLGIDSGTGSPSGENGHPMEAAP